jgi:A/G-specific adenine glycosylase
MLGLDESIKDWFASQVSVWQLKNGRHDLPWQKTRDPYKIWVSEVMLQQTQVKTVIPYYLKFLKRFPSIRSLAKADLDSILVIWSGLGYYSRARNLHQAARTINTQYSGRFPSDFESIVGLRGIGKSTAGAILVFAFNERFSILDANVKRVVTRFFYNVLDVGVTRSKNQLWSLVDDLLPSEDIVEYTQGLMDLGAGICKPRAPLCELCPLSKHCYAFARGLFGVNQKPKPRQKSVMTKNFLVFKRGSRIILQKGSSSGIWPDLLNFPECTNDQLIKLPFFLQQYKFQFGEIAALPTLTHELTHLKIKIRVFLIQISSSQLPRLINNSAWIHISDLDNQPIPKVVRKIMTLIAKGKSAP